MFFVVLLLAHVQAILIPAWIAHRINIRHSELGDILAEGGISILRFGFICFGIAAFAEMLDHTETSWIYINRISGWNGLFYAGLAGGLASLTAAVTENKKLRILIYVIVVISISAYLAFGKGVTISLQSIITALFLAQWWKRFHDPLLLVYPICGVVLTTFFGGMLSTSGNQIWHIFIGPSGSISLITIWMILNRSKSKTNLPIMNIHRN